MSAILRDFIHPRPEKFYESRNRWLKLPKIEVYLIAGFSMVHGKFASSVKVSNLNLLRQEDEGKGYFRGMILEIEEEAAAAGYGYVTFENTASHLADKLMKHGYVLSQPENEWSAFGKQLCKPLNPSQADLSLEAINGTTA